MFIGREYEIKALNKLYDKDSFQFVVMYGRRRVGKTRLLTEFCKDKEHIFFVAEEYNEKMALEKFSQKILQYFQMEEFMSSFESWEKAFMFLAKQSRDKKLILVIDEFPYIAMVNKSIPSLLQNLIDHYLKDTKLYVIVCGSSMSFMEKEVLSYKSPLYGRRTAQFKIEPFDFYDSIKFFPEYSMEDKVKAYGVLGGIPQYLLKFQGNKNIKENIKNELLNKSSYLYDEPLNLLKQELREPAMYNSIIEAIATGSSKLNEISTKIGEEGSKCSNYLKTLIELQIISKEVPVGEKENSKRTVYRIRDNMFNFWYRFLFSNSSLIEQEMVDYVYENKIEPEFSNYLGRIFEQVCRDYLVRKNRNLKLPFVFENIGSWWGSNPIKKRQEEIDILAISKDKAIIGECKWRNEYLDMDVVNSLMEKATLLPYKEKYFIFFSKSGFTKRVIEYASSCKNIYLCEDLLVDDL
ncbi:ATP-binding protein [Haloimpatiens lingqiaonensis]|uniref:ATP-binding protein n=1 Tax=Haloimpatiens lingqiaonensis TaxID=1380675 RepID=UPI0010FF17AE|nr:ATP-binding protein [Haloimpatiens lingqiaonensis]